MKRAVAIQNPARLRIEHAQLLIQNDQGKHTVPLQDLGILVVDHESVDVTGPMLGELGEHGIALVACNSKHLPSAILLPYEGHALMAQILRGQIDASKPTKKRIWREIVMAKIESQARYLVVKRGDDFGLAAMAARVFSGDSTNREGAAAGAYWQALFGEGFVRLRREESPKGTPTNAVPLVLTNALLNYGYAILRAAVARAIVLAGLHPALGIHHRHRENTFSLADDLMEPLRVLVDRQACDILEGESELPPELNPALKRRMLQILTAEVTWDEGLWPLDAALEAYAAQVRKCLLGERKVLEVPGA